MDSTTEITNLYIDFSLIIKFNYLSDSTSYIVENVLCTAIDFSNDMNQETMKIEGEDK